MRKVAGFQHFRSQLKRNWTAKEDVLNERGAVVAGVTRLAPYSPHLLAKNGKMYTQTMAYEEMSIKVIIEDELKGESLEELEAQR